MRGLKKKIRFNFLIHCPDSWEFLHLISSVNRMFVEAKLHLYECLELLRYDTSSKVQYLISKCEFSKMGFHLSSWHFLITNTWQKFKHKDWPMTAKQMNLTFKKKLRSSLLFYFFIEAITMVSIIIYSSTVSEFTEYLLSTLGTKSI